MFVTLLQRVLAAWVIGCPYSPCAVKDRSYAHGDHSAVRARFDVGGEGHEAVLPNENRREVRCM